VQTDTLSHKNPCKKAHALVKNCRQTKNEKKKSQKGKTADRSTYFSVDIKLIFHLPTFPDPCWVEVLAGE
jgi:hypothetical protein